MDTRMDGWTMRDKEQRQGNPNCQVSAAAQHHGGVKGYRVLLDDDINHAFITPKKKQPLVLPQTYLHLVTLDLDTKEAKIERCNGRTK